MALHLAWLADLFLIVLKTDMNSCLLTCYVSRACDLLHLLLDALGDCLAAAERVKFGQ